MTVRTAIVGLQQLLVLVTVALCHGCAGLSTLYPYPARVAPVLKNVRNNVPVSPERVFRRETGGPDGVLYHLERGRIAQILGKTELSLREFDAAIAITREKDDRALFTATGAAQLASAMIINDAMIPYTPPPFERVMMYHAQIWNYLLAGKLEEAVVEVRRANMEQEAIAERTAQDLQRARKTAESRQIDWRRIETEIDKTTQLRSGSDVTNSAYTYYLSAVTYELAGQLNDAYIDYKRALALYPDNRYVRNDVRRLAAALGFDEPADSATSSTIVTGGPDRQIGETTGTLVIFFEEEFVPPKGEITLPFPVSSDPPTIIAISLPIYQERRDLATPLTAKFGIGDSTVSEPLADYVSMAARALRSAMPAIVVRQIVRAIAKKSVVAEAERHAGLAGWIVAEIAVLATEQADRRSWSTLPASVQIVRAQLPAGRRTISLSHGGFRGLVLVDVDIAAGGTTLLQVIRTNGTVYTHQAVLTGDSAAD